MSRAAGSNSGRADAGGASAWQLDTLHQAHQLARRRGHQQVTTEHLALVLAEADAAVVRHWRSLGIDVTRAQRELARPGLPESARYGRSYQFLASVPDEIVVTAEAAEFFRECSRLDVDVTGKPADADVASTILMFLPTPLPGSALLGEHASNGTGSQGGSGAPNPNSRPRPRVDDADGSALDRFGRDLTQLAAMGRLDALIGREAEVEAVLRVLRRRAKRNPLLVGEPGVGKTAIVEGVAKRIAAGELDDARLISIDLPGILAGTRYRGEFEERVQLVLDEALHSTNPTILFVDEFHLIARTGAAEGGLDLGSILLAPMARGQIAVIGATTPTDYRRHLRYAGPLLRRVQVIEVAEPTPAQSLDILRGVRGQYERFHDVVIDEAALHRAVDLGRRTEGQLPDSALDLIDDACAHARVRAAANARPTVTAVDVTAMMATRPSGLLHQSGPLSLEQVREAVARLRSARRRWLP